MGFVFDPSTHSLRRIEGIPGAALVGAPVDFGFAVSAVDVAPRQDSVFVMAGEGAVHLFRLTADAPQEIAVDSLGARLQVFYSPSGTAAALLSPGSVRVIKGLPGAPVVGSPIGLRSNERPLRIPYVLAVSDDGAYLLYGTGGPIELIGVAGNSRQATNAAPGALAAFAPGGHDAAVINDTRLTLFQDIAGAATERSFLGVVAPTALAYSPDGQKLFVASADGRSVTTIQVATGDRYTLPCDCAPRVLTPMGSLFRLNQLGTEPLWLLDTASDRGLVFVPAPAGN
jgi:DNA-binding beta-propeller fold protein YncE